MPKPTTLSLESSQTLDRLAAQRRAHVVRATRSHERQVARREWKKVQARIAAREAAKRQEIAAQQAQEAANAAENEHTSSNQRVNLSGIAACIAKYESGGNPTAQNPTSSASGLYQFIDGTWDNYGGYSRAMYAPVSVQTEKFYQVWDGGRGAHNWVVAPRCGY